MRQEVFPRCSGPHGNAPALDPAADPSCGDVLRGTALIRLNYMEEFPALASVAMRGHHVAVTVNPTHARGQWLTEDEKQTLFNDLMAAMEASVKNAIRAEAVVIQLESVIARRASQANRQQLRESSEGGAAKQMLAHCIPRQPR